MTDRGVSALRQSATTFEVGPSRLAWSHGRLAIDVDEMGGLPFPGRIRGRIVLTPTGVTDVELPLTPDGTHVWRPFAPTASVSVDLGPGWQWTGHGYFDANFGTRALEADFDFWTWGRYPLKRGAVVFYDADRRDGTHLSQGFAFSPDGRATVFNALPRTPLAPTLWRLRRETRADPGHDPVQVMPMLDAPFYSRSVVRTRIEGVESEGVHEALDLRRFRWPALMPMLAVRVPRRAKWRFPPE